MKKFLPLLNRPARNGPFLPKFRTALATVIVGIFFEKNFGEVLDRYQLPIGRNFEYLKKNGVFKFFKSLSVHTGAVLGLYYITKEWFGLLSQLSRFPGPFLEL